MSNRETFAQTHEKRRRLAREQGLSFKVLRGLYTSGGGASAIPIFPEEVAPKRRYVSMGRTSYALLTFCIRQWRKLPPLRSGAPRCEATFWAVLVTYAFEALNEARKSAGLPEVTADFDALLQEWEDTIKNDQYRRERGFCTPNRRFEIDNHGRALELVPTKEELKK